MQTTFASDFPAVGVEVVREAAAAKVRDTQERSVARADGHRARIHVAQSQTVARQALI